MYFVERCGLGVAEDYNKLCRGCSPWLGCGQNLGMSITKYSGDADRTIPSSQTSSEPIPKTLQRHGMKLTRLSHTYPFKRRRG
jgi:hypothetical protein